MRDAAWLVLVGLLVACRSPEQTKLERGMLYARAQFVRAGRNPIAAASLASTIESGGTLSSYLYAGMAANSNLPKFQDYTPTEPWSVVLVPIGGDTVVIQGFGESLARPVRVDRVLLRAPPRR